MIEEFQAANEFVELRFKNEHPDNLSDLLVADVMISNLSSFLAYFYVLRRPSLHIHPGGGSARALERAVMLFSRFRLRCGFRQRDAWMLDPRDTGGPIICDTEEAVRQAAAALDNLDSGRSPTGSWLARHIPRIDGGACRRFEAELRALCGLRRESRRLAAQD